MSVLFSRSKWLFCIPGVNGYYMPNQSNMVMHHGESRGSSEWPIKLPKGTQDRSFEDESWNNRRASRFEGSFWGKSGETYGETPLEVMDYGGLAIAKSNDIKKAML